MSEPEIRFQVAYDSHNIESNVPGTQNLREDAPGDDHRSTPREKVPRDVTDDASSKKETEDALEVPKTEKTEREVASTSQDVAPKEDFVLTPVITVTKKEAVLTKGDLKLQQVSVTEDISGTESEVTVSHKVTVGKTAGTRGEEVSRVQQTRITRYSDERDNMETTKHKTRIPTLRFRQAVDKLNTNRNSFEEKKEPETRQQTAGKTSIPRFKDLRTPPKELFSPRDDRIFDMATLDDDFEKLYDEIGDDQIQDDNLSIASSIDTVKLETSFNEIIHSYEENKVQPINIEKTRSKIPLLKRNSEHEIDVPKQNISLPKLNNEQDSIPKHTIPTPKQSVSVDTKTSTLVESDKNSKIKSATLNKSPIRTTLLSKRFSETQSVQEVSTERSIESFSTVGDSSSEGKTVTKDSKVEVTKNQTKSRQEISNKGSDNEKNNTTADVKETKEKIGKDEIKSKQTVSSSKENVVTKEIKETVKVATPVFGNISEQTLSNGKVNVTTKEVKQTVETEILNNESKIDQIISNGKENVTTKEIKDSVKLPTTIFESTLPAEFKNFRRIDPKTSEYEAKIINNNEDHVVYTKKEDKVIKSSTNKIQEEFKTFEQKEEKIVQSESTSYETKYVKEVQYETISHTTSTKTIDSSTEVNYKEIKEKKDNTDVNTEELIDDRDEEDIIILKGKVNRIIRRMDSIDANPPSKKEVDDDLPKDKSVMSKIAMFERPEPEEPPPRARIRCKSNIPRYNSQESHDATEDDSEIPHESKETHELIDDRDDKPKIVHEVLKALPARVTEEYEYTDITKDDDTNPNINTGIVEEYYPNPFDVEITDLQPKLPVNDSSKETELNGVESYAPFDNVLKHDKSKNLSPMIVEEISFEPVFVEQFPIESETKTQSADLNKNNSKGIHRIEPAFIETEFKPKNKFNYEKDHVKENISNNIERNKKVGVSQNEIIPDLVCSRKNRFERANSKEASVEGSKTETKEGKEIIKLKEDGVFSKRTTDGGSLRILSHQNNGMDRRNGKSLAELDLGDAVKGKVRNMIVRMKSVEKLDLGRREVIDIRERPRKRSVSDMIALFERKIPPAQSNSTDSVNVTKPAPAQTDFTEAEYAQKIEELVAAKAKYGTLDQERMKYVTLADGGKMPAVGVGTALLNPRLTRHIVAAAIDLGYRTIDTAYIYGTERDVGEAIRDKIKDGTVKREELFVISKLWSTFHRKDLVEKACRASLSAMGLDYFDLYLIHNPMSFKEGDEPIPKIANVIQYSEHDYLEAWYGMEELVRAGLIKRAGVSNFNSQQIDRILDKGKIKPLVNQVECHPYLSQDRLDDFCSARNISLCCFGVLGSKGTPQELKSALPPIIDDPLVRVMAAGMDFSPAQLLISYQLTLGRTVVVKASSAARLWDNMAATRAALAPADVSALRALNRNKRTFTFKGMGETHKNYPFNIPF